MTELVENSQSYRQWMGRLAQSTQYVQGNYFNTWMNWVRVNGGKFKDFTPDQMIEYQREADNGSRYDLLDLAIDYVNSNTEAYNTKKSRYANIRSFFRHNRAELPRESINIQKTKPQVIGTLTPEEIKLNIVSSNPAYRTAYLCIFQAAMDQEGFTYWNESGYSDLVTQLKENPDTVRIMLPGRKGAKNVQPYYTFITRDAIEALRNWLKIRAKLVKKGKIPEGSEAIITNQFGEPLTKKGLKSYWFRHLMKNGIISPDTKGRTGKSIHEMRDTWRSLWSKSPANHIVGEYFMGHQIDSLGYDKSFRDVEYYRDEYMKAAPYLNLISSGAAYGLVEAKKQDKRIEELEAENEELRAQLEKQSRDALAMFEELEKRIKNLETR